MCYCDGSTAHPEHKLHLITRRTILTASRSTAVTQSLHSCRPTPAAPSKDNNAICYKKESKCLGVRKEYSFMLTIIKANSSLVTQCTFGGIKLNISTFKAIQDVYP